MFNFPNNGLIETDDFFSEFSEPVEEFATPEPTLQPTPEPAEPIKSEIYENATVTESFLELNEDISGFLTDTADGLAAFAIAWFVAKNNEADRYRLPEREIEKIKLLVKKMVPAHKPIMPTWAALLVTIGGAYTPIIATALQDKKLAEKEAEIEALKAQLKEKHFKTETNE